MPKSLTNRNALPATAEIALPIDAEHGSTSAPPPPRRLIRLNDIFLLAINGLFVVMGMVLLPSQPDVAVVTLALFGSGLFTTALMLWKRLTNSTFNARRVEVVGGVRIRPLRRLLLLIGGWMLLLGFVLVVFGSNYPLLFRLLSGGIGLAGAAVMAAALAGILPRGFLQFDPAGLTIGQARFQALLPWDEITHVAEGEYQMNPVVLLHVGNLDAIAITPERERAKAVTSMARSIGFFGAPFMLMPAHFGIAAPVLAEAVRRYVADDAARASLRPLLGNAPRAKP